MSEASAILRLRAADAEDFRVLAACLQDALVPVGDMTFDGDAREFVMVVNRYRWENPADRERIHSAVHFTGVDAVRRRGLDPRARGQIFDLLTIDAQSGAVELLFAGDAALRLEGGQIACRLSDLGDPWPAASEPRHPAD